MEIFLIKTLQFILAIGLLVLLHEGGHFFFSKLFGVRVEKFYLFFDVTVGKWKGSLFKFKPKKSDTQYGVGWLPLGGYCKIAGMIDESFDTEQMKKPAQPWEFRSKPAWQRLLIMIGGVLVNFLLALFIYSMVLYHWGDSYVPLSKMTQGMEFNEQAKALGFQDGDILISTNDGPFKGPRFESGIDINAYRMIANASEVNILRNGKPLTIRTDQELSLLTMGKEWPPFMRTMIPAVIDSVVKNSAADKAGLQKGDKLVMVNGQAVNSYFKFVDQIANISHDLEDITTHDDSLKLRQITLAYQRDGRIDTVSATLSEDLKLGFVPAMQYQPDTISYSFLGSFPAGIAYGCNVLRSYVDDMKYVFTSDGAKSLGGFGAIGNLFPETWDWYRFWMMTAFLSIILAFMNILPIPALDGGHVLFLLYEIITRRKPSEKFMIWAEYVGFGILILLMIVANLNDILRWIGVM